MAETKAPKMIKALIGATILAVTPGALAIAIVYLLSRRFFTHIKERRARKLRIVK